MSRLQALEDVLTGLEGALRRERAAVGALDANAIADAGMEKAALIDRARGLVHGAEEAEVFVLRRTLSDGLARLAPMARANAALIADASDSIAVALGLSPASAGTYDGRARMRHAYRRAASRAL